MGWGKVEVPLIIDIEASGFGPQGYPIEVGVALPDDRRYCRLVHPEPDWTWWNDDAEKVHNISRALLQTRGIPVLQVAKDLNRLLAGQTVYSDGWVVDDPWLIKLYQKAGIDRSFRMYDLLTILDETAMTLWHQVKDEVIAELGMARHRASHDAYIVQQTYVRLRQRRLN